MDISIDLNKVEEGNKLVVFDLFAGTRSIAKAFEERGHEVYTVEWDEQHENIDWYADMMDVTAKELIERFGQPDIVWASPPCNRFSVASIGHHWHKGTDLPKTEEAVKGLALLEHTVQLIKDLNPTYFFMENPRGKMRKMDVVQDWPIYTVTYCQYGDTRMKPTDIWTNHPSPNFREMCKNGDPCHVSAPRGSQTGTQGIKGSVARSIIPEELCRYIVEISEGNLYTIVDINDSDVYLADRWEGNTIEDLRTFLDDIWASHVYGDGEEYEEPVFNSYSFPQIQEALGGVGYFAELEPLYHKEEELS